MERILYLHLQDLAIYPTWLRTLLYFYKFYSRLARINMQHKVQRSTYSPFLETVEIRFRVKSPSGCIVKMFKLQFILAFAA